MFPEFPVYPLKLARTDGTVIELLHEDHAALYLEFFNSESKEDLRKWHIKEVTDKLGRPVVLVVDRCDVTRLELRKQSM